MSEIAIDADESRVRASFFDGALAELP